MSVLYFLSFCLALPYLAKQESTPNSTSEDLDTLLSNHWPLMFSRNFFPSFVQLVGVYPSRLKTSAYVEMSGPSAVRGKVNLKQLKNGPLLIFGRLKGLPRVGKFGFHFHEFPIKGDCGSAGAHFNPNQMTHGGKKSFSRHVGDMGNVIAHYNGVAHIVIIDNIASLIGPFSVLGRSLVIHANQDDLGKGGNEESLRTGNSGGRLACGTVLPA